MAVIARLIDDHSELTALADTLLSVARLPDMTAKQCRIALARFSERLNAHREAEKRFIECMALDLEPDLLVLEFATFEESLSELFAQCDDYLLRWSEAQIAAHRASFAGQTTDLMTMLKLRFEQENEILTSLDDLDRLTMPVGPHPASRDGRQFALDFHWPMNTAA